MNLKFYPGIVDVCRRGLASRKHAIRSASHLMTMVRSVLLLTVSTSSLLAQSPDFTRPTWATEWEYTEVSAIRVLSDGCVLLLDAMERRLYALTAVGRLIRQIGRSGAGPGEFEEPVGLVTMSGDITVVIDHTLKRALYLSGNFSFGRTVLFPEMSSSGPNRFTRADSHGRLLFATFNPVLNLPQSTVVRWVPGMARLDTIATLRRAPMTSARNIAGVMGVQFALPLRLEDGWAMLPDDRIVAVRANPYVVEIPTLNEAPNRAPMRVPIRAPQVPVAAWERSQVNPDVRDSMPRFKPPFIAEAIVSGEEGSVWIPRYRAADAKVRLWEVVQSGGGRHAVRTTSSEQTVLAVTRSGIYMARKGPDDLQRLEFHPHRGT